MSLRRVHAQRSNVQNGRTEEGTMAKNNFKRKKKPGVIRRILPYFVIILVAAALIVAVIVITSRKGNKERQEIQTVVDVTENQKNNNQIQTLEKDGVPAVKELVQKYFDAVKNADVKQLTQIVSQETPFSEEALKKQCEYVESYDNIVCYTVPGIADNTYIAYVYYEIKFIGIDTKAPSMIRLYICQNEDGSLYIDKNAKDGEIAAYLQEVAGWESVRELVANVNTRYQEACVKDEALKNLKDMLDGKTTVLSSENASDEEISADASAEDSTEQLSEENTSESASEVSSQADAA